MEKEIRETIEVARDREEKAYSTSTKKKQKGRGFTTDLRNSNTEESTTSTISETSTSSVDLRSKKSFYTFSLYQASLKNDPSTRLGTIEQLQQQSGYYLQNLYFNLFESRKKTLEECEKNLEWKALDRSWSVESLEGYLPKACPW